MSIWKKIFDMSRWSDCNGQYTFSKNKLKLDKVGSPFIKMTKDTTGRINKLVRQYFGDHTIESLRESEWQPRVDNEDTKRIRKAFDTVRQNMADKKLSSKSSGNVFADLGLDNAEELLARSDSIITISNVLTKLGYREEPDEGRTHYNYRGGKVFVVDMRYTSKADWAQVLLEVSEKRYKPSAEHFSTVDIVIFDDLHKEGLWIEL